MPTGRAHGSVWSHSRRRFWERGPCRGRGRSVACGSERRPQHDVTVPTSGTAGQQCLPQGRESSVECWGEAQQQLEVGGWPGSRWVWHRGLKHRGGPVGQGLGGARPGRGLGVGTQWGGSPEAPVCPPGSVLGRGKQGEVGFTTLGSGRAGVKVRPRAWMGSGLCGVPSPPHHLAAQATWSPVSFPWGPIL